jgi:23S rRNA pseudouridine955/2504/2580 synthase
MIPKNKKRKVSSIIEKEYAGYRIDNYLSEKFEYHSRNLWQNIIRDEIITINKKPCKPSKILKPDDVVEFIIEDFEEPECNLNYKIVYEDEHILAVNKPYNCIIHPVGPFFKNTLTYQLEENLGYPVYSVNRLDRETTGLVLLGKDSKTAKLLSQYFIDKKIYKEYTVAVHGNFPNSLSTKGFLLRDDKSTVRKKRKFQYEYPESAPETDFETSETDFELIETKQIKESIIGFANDRNSLNITEHYTTGQIIPGSRLLPDAREINVPNEMYQEKNYGKNVSLVKVMLKTGRQHQIRATLCSLGYPVIGDKLYGIDDTIYLRFIEKKMDYSDTEKLLINHQALHAGKLEFIHPYSGEDIFLKSPIPEEMLSIFF